MHRGNSLTPFSKWLQSVELGAATTHLIKVPPAFEIAFFFFFKFPKRLGGALPSSGLDCLYFSVLKAV